MRKILVIAYKPDNSISAMYQIYGDRHNWKYCYGAIRETEQGNRLVITNPL